MKTGEHRHLVYAIRYLSSLKKRRYISEKVNCVPDIFSAYMWWKPSRNWSCQFHIMVSFNGNIFNTFGGMASFQLSITHHKENIDMKRSTWYLFKYLIKSYKSKIYCIALWWYQLENAAGTATSDSHWWFLIVRAFFEEVRVPYGNSIYSRRIILVTIYTRKAKRFEVLICRACPN